MFSQVIGRIKLLFNAEAIENARKKVEAAVKNFTKKDHLQEKVSDEFIKRKKQSLNDSQGVDDFSGSSYKAPGNVDHEKTNSNMGQRNF